MVNKTILLEAMTAPLLKENCRLSFADCFLQTLLQMASFLASSFYRAFRDA